MRSALQTLPWVEPDSIQTNVDTHEARFTVKDGQPFNFEEVQKALEKAGYDKVTLKSKPS